MLSTNQLIRKEENVLLAIKYEFFRLHKFYFFYSIKSVAFYQDVYMERCGLSEKSFNESNPERDLEKSVEYKLVVWSSLFLQRLYSCEEYVFFIPRWFDRGNGESSVASVRNGQGWRPLTETRLKSNVHIECNYARPIFRTITNESLLEHGQIRVQFLYSSYGFVKSGLT